MTFDRLATMLVVALGILTSGAPLAAQDSGKSPKKGGDPKAAPAEEPVIEDDGIPAKDLHAGGDAMKRYLLIGPKTDQKARKEGFGLLIVMPGGPGTADFHGFVKNLWQSCCPDDFVVAQLVAPKWIAEPSVIWPMKPGDQPGMQFTTLEQMQATLDDIAKVQKLKIDPRRTYQLAWSSSGPAAYPIALQEKPLVAGSYIAMSVFHESDLTLSRAKGRAFFLDHSPDDTTCKFAEAERAKEKLTKEGAKVELVTYQGGHGWNDDPMARLKKGIAWLEENRGKPAK